MRPRQRRPSENVCDPYTASKPLLDRLPNRGRKGAVIELILYPIVERRHFLTGGYGLLMKASPLASVKALTFDVFGTVVDWRSSVIREAERLGRTKGIRADWARFADAWRAGYGPSMDRVRRGELPWTKLDDL